MEKVILPECQKGDWTISKITVERISYRDAFMGRGCPIGETYTKLTRKNKIVMSDTPAEMRDHYEALLRAKGSCLINGLGIGMLLKNILLKDSVTDVTVVEISQDLIDLVSPHYRDPRVTYVCSSAFDYKPPKGKRYKMVWHDIWDDICADNLPEMTKLHRKYGKKTDWQDSWCKYQCQQAKKSYRSGGFW